MLANAIEGIADQFLMFGWGMEIGSCWVQHMAKVQYTDEDRYVPRNDVINSVWGTGCMQDRQLKHSEFTKWTKG
jgi:hypothetical protein